jgi:hypothetical protein
LEADNCFVKHLSSTPTASVLSWPTLHTWPWPRYALQSALKDMFGAALVVSAVRVVAIYLGSWAGCMATGTLTEFRRLFWLSMVTQVRRLSLVWVPVVWGGCDGSHEFGCIAGGRLLYSGGLGHILSEFRLHGVLLCKVHQLGWALFCAAMLLQTTPSLFCQGTASATPLPRQTVLSGTSVRFLMRTL